MALEIRSIPVLTGETAERFVREADKRGLEGKPVQFSKEFAEAAERMIERSRKFQQEMHGKKIIFGRLLYTHPSG